MRRLLGGSFFIAAAIYMAVSKPIDPITLLAMLRGSFYYDLDGRWHRAAAEGCD